MTVLCSVLGHSQFFGHFFLSEYFDLAAIAQLPLSSDAGAVYAGEYPTASSPIV
jgi:hypothetical protein